MCVDLSVEGRGTGEKARLKGEGGEMMEDEEEREGGIESVTRGSVTNEANITRPIQLNTRSAVTVGKTEYF